MFFKKKTNKSACPHCNNKVSSSYTFCPYCGSQIMSKEQEEDQFGLIGRTDAQSKAQPQDMFAQLMQNMLKNINLSGMMDNAEVKNMPNGFKIKIGLPGQAPKKKISQPKVKSLTEEQALRMADMPRAMAKTNIKRLSDKVVYELAAQGIQSTQDVFVSKLESGYEIKAIGKNKVYVNSLPINLPLKSYSIGEKGITLEFDLE